MSIAFVSLVPVKLSRSSVSFRLRAVALSVLCLFLCSAMSGCTTEEELEAETTLQAALNNLVQNRSLTEQFVRDIKANADPSDPGYVQAMDSYQDARDSYHHYLDSVESGHQGTSTRSLRSSKPLDVQNATADFLADATSVLKPTVNTRRVPFQRAVVIPENLQATLNKLPRKARERLIDQFDEQVRWRSWGQI